MAETDNDYNPGPWKGWDYGSARKAYDPNAGRGYDDDTSPKVSVAKKAEPLLPDSITTASKSPLIIAVDGTGSMGVFPETIFKKLPLLDDGIDDYLEGNPEIAYAMVGDAKFDKYALQIQPFSRGKGMVEALNKLIIEGGGGGNATESYELCAAYALHNAKMDSAITPIMIFICDEGIPKNLSKDLAKDHALVNLEKDVSVTELFNALKQKMRVYCIRKDYGGALEHEIQNQWVGLLGQDHVVILDDPARVVDVILGILAHETGNLNKFHKELSQRQSQTQVQTVMDAMVTLGKNKPKQTHTGFSIAKTANGKSLNSKSLI